MVLVTAVIGACFDLRQGATINDIWTSAWPEDAADAPGTAAVAAAGAGGHAADAPADDASSDAPPATTTSTTAPNSDAALDAFCARFGVQADRLAELMVPEGAHNRALDWTLCFLRPPEANQAAAPHVCLTVVRTHRDADAKRGAVVRSVAVVTTLPHEVLRAPLLLLSELYCESPSLALLAAFGETLNALDLSGMPRPSEAERRLATRGIRARTDSAGSACAAHTPSDPRWSWRAAAPLFGASDGVPLKFPLSMSPLGSPRVSELVLALGPAAMRVYHAVATGRRVLFVGAGHAAGDVCRLALAAAGLVSPPVPPWAVRLLPYASLTDLSFIESGEAYVAGVTNPVFESNREWFDLLVRLDLTGDGGLDGGGAGRGGKCAVVSAEELGRPPPPPSASDDRRSDADRQAEASADAAFLSRVLAGHAAGLGEDWVRRQFHDHTQRILDLAVDTKIDLDLDDPTPAHAKFTAAYTSAARRVGAGPCFVGHAAIDPFTVLGGDACVPDTVDGAALRHAVRRASTQVGGATAEDLELLADGVATEAAAQVLCVLLPESRGGLEVLALGAVSPDRAARAATRRLMDTVRSFDSTRPAFDALNLWVRMAVDSPVGDA